jgi:LacI family transcriptional regulator
MKKLSIKEIAHMAGVGTGTVSRVLNDRYGVDPQTREHVRRVIEESGYRPDEFARNLRTRRSNSVVFFVSDIANPSFSPIAKAVQHILDQHGYRFILHDTGDVDVDRKMSEVLINTPADGAIICVPTEELPLTGQWIRSHQFPTLVIDREIPDIELDSIQTDYYTGIQGATQHLQALGHHRIGLILGVPNIRPARESLKGYKDAVESMGAKVDESLIAMGPFHVEFAKKAMENWFTHRKEDSPTALIVISYAGAVGVLEWCQEHKLAIPNDLSLIAFEDVDLLRLTTPAITVIKRSLHDLGGKAGEIILQAMEARYNQPHVERVRVIQKVSTQLVERQSCKPLTN